MSAFSLFRQPSLRVLMLVLAALSAAACASSPVSVGLRGEMAAPYHLKYDNWALRKPPAVYVRPNASPNSPPTALFVPLRVNQDISQPQALSRNVSRQIWQVWLSQNAFSTLEYEDAFVPARVTDALPAARRRGAQLLAGGYVNHFMDGGPGGDSSLSLHMEIYEVDTGVLLWSMAQGGSFEKKQAADLFLVSVEARMPDDPMGALIRALAYDMGMQLRYWAHPESRSKGLPDPFKGKAF